MGARDYKTFRAGNFYHIFNRGNNKMPIFLDTQDYQVFLHRLKIVLSIPGAGSNLPHSRIRVKPLPPGSFTIFCYCLMSNHFHFLIRPESNIGVDKLMAKVCTSYAKFFNAKYQRVGHLFQDTFKAKIVDSDQYLIHLSAYIHCNPFDPFSYNYSSLPAYLGRRNDPLCNSSYILSMFSSRESYRNYLENIKAKSLFDNR
jgi:putative transposase